MMKDLETAPIWKQNISNSAPAAGKNPSRKEISRIMSAEENIARSAIKSGAAVMGSTMFGVASARPQAGTMLKYGARSSAYFATDTYALSFWTGTQWKSVTLA